MAYRHGVYVRETATSILAPREVDSAIPFVVGTAPVHLSGTGLDDTDKRINTPALCYKFEEAASKLGYSSDFTSYTLCEFMDVYFRVFNVCPAIFVNVLDPSVHKKSVAAKEYTLSSGKAILGPDVILDSVLATGADGELTAGTDYSLGWNKSAEAVFNVLPGGALGAESSVSVAFDRVDPSMVTAEDIIGGYNSVTKATEGLELINQCFTRFGKVPALICAPGWSENPVVAAVMSAKAVGISGLFSAISLTDIPSDSSGVEDYAEAGEWKRRNNYTDGYQIACWPACKLRESTYHLSSVLAAVIAATDEKYGQIPYASPSNKLAKMTGAVTKSGREILLDLNQVNMLNENGILTLFNWESDWMTWGNEMGCYPSNTDPKDRFINIRRFYNWWAVKFILRYWQKVDSPINRRLLETIQDSENIQINAYTAQGVLVGPENHIEFRVEDNPVTDLADGIIRAHTFLTVPPPARVIENVLEYKAENILTIFL